MPDARTQPRPRPRRDDPRRDADDADDADGPDVLAHPADPTPPPAAWPAAPPETPPPLPANPAAAASEPPGRNEAPADIDADEFAAGFGESLRQALDLK